MQAVIRLFLLCALFAWQAACLASPAALLEFNAQYSLYRLGVKVGSSTRELKRLPENQFRLSVVNQVGGLAALLRDDEIIETSIFDWQQAQIKPRHYQYLHQSTAFQKTLSIDFNWLEQTVTNTTEKMHWTMPVPLQTLDKLNYQLAVSQDLLQGKRGNFNYAVADGGKLKNYQLIFVDEEVLETSLGHFKTLHYRRQSTRKERLQEWWFAAKLDYLPVRMEYHDPNGGYVRMEIEQITGLTLKN